MAEFLSSFIRSTTFRASSDSNNMFEQLIQDWLSDLSALAPEEVHSFATSLAHNDDIVTSIYSLLDERSKHAALVDSVCDQLFAFYRSREVEMQRFTLQFVPTLIYTYLNCVAHGDKTSCRSVETLLIGIYNLEVSDERGQPVVISFRLPSLAQASIYHEPSSLSHASFTETALRRLEECNTNLVTWGPLPPVDALNAQNRLKVMTSLMFVFNRHIGSLHRTSLKILCKASSRLVTQGFPRPGCHQRTSSVGSEPTFHPRVLPRIPLSSHFLLELTTGLYYAMYNDAGYLAVQCLEDIHQRSCYECYPEVVLVTNSIKNSAHVTSSGQPSEGPMGISVALSPATNTVTTVSKSMITNASFRTKKLPDDIPIVPKEENVGELRSLAAITEEREGDATDLTPRGSSMRGKDSVTKNLQKLGIGKKKDAKQTGGKTVNSTADKEKGNKKPLRCQAQNGDGLDGDHSPVLPLRKRSILDNGLIDTSNGAANGRSSSTATGFSSDSQSLMLTSESLDSSIPLDDDMMVLDRSPASHADIYSEIDDKPYMQVSSV